MNKTSVCAETPLRRVINHLLSAFKLGGERIKCYPYYLCMWPLNTWLEEQKYLFYWSKWTPNILFKLTLILFAAGPGDEQQLVM